MDKEKTNRLDYLRMHYVDSLRIAMTKLKETAESCLKKIEHEGVSGRYSSNSDIHRYASAAWRASLALSELSRLDDMVNAKIEEETVVALQEMLDSRKQLSSEE